MAGAGQAPLKPAAAVWKGKYWGRSGKWGVKWVWVLEQEEDGHSHRGEHSIQAGKGPLSLLLFLVSLPLLLPLGRSRSWEPRAASAEDEGLCSKRNKRYESCALAAVTGGDAAAGASLCCLLTALGISPEQSTACSCLGRGRSLPACFLVLRADEAQRRGQQHPPVL